MLTEEQLKERQSHWTATDSARAISGEYGGLFAVVSEKLGAPPQPENEAMEIGSALEGPLGQWAINKLREAGWQVLGKQVPAFSKTHPQLSATVDVSMVNNIGESSEYACVELKTAGFASAYTDNSDWGDVDSQDIPLYVMIQVHHQMLCTGDQFCFVAAWVHGRGRLLYRIERDEKICDAIVAVYEHVWDNYVAKKVLPPITEDCAEQALAFYKNQPTVARQEVKPTKELEDAVDMYEHCRSVRLGIEKQEKISAAKVLRLMGNGDFCRIKPKKGVRIVKTKIKAFVSNHPERTQTTIKIDKG
ncbi:YqaJ viral recombinase family protein [Nitrospira sp. BLG_1]|uniref:YqaJ viral recombinase family protein n=1 Tax=Nitrospira sp. BLG_1 TaxID=3395883 RepID=UPI0039BC270D